MIYSKQDDIVRVKTHKRRRPEHYYWLSNPTYLGFIRRRPGVYTHNFFGFAMSSFVSEEPKEIQVLMDGVLYLKPHIEFEHSNGRVTTKYFNSPEKMTNFVEDFINETGVPWISDD